MLLYAQDEIEDALTDQQLTPTQAIATAAAILAESYPGLNTTQMESRLARSIDRMRASAMMKSRLKSGLKRGLKTVRVNKRIAAAWRARRGTNRIRAAARSVGTSLRVNKRVANAWQKI